MNTDPLAQLRDIHLPEAIGWWPPAPGWWLLAIILLVSLLLSVRYLVRRRRQLYFRQQAQDLLSECWQRYQLEITQQDNDLQKPDLQKNNHHENKHHKNKDRQFVESLFAIIQRAIITRNDGSKKIDGDTPVSRHTDKTATDSSIKDQQLPEIKEPQLKTISSEQMFNLLNDSSSGELSKYLDNGNIEALLYQANPLPLKKDQAEQLYAAARHSLKRGMWRC